MITTPFIPAKPGAIPLAAGDVHLWRVSLHHRAPADTALEAAEQERIGRLIDPRTRARRLNCRNILRRILGAYLQRPPAQLRFRSGPHGRPHLDEGIHPTDLNFNLSHAGALAVIALARVQPLGIDIEFERPLPRLNRLLERCFSTAEAQFLNGRAGDGRARLFLRAWTAKEAVLKAMGTGIFHRPAAVEIAWEPTLHLARLAGDPAQAAAWKLWEFVPAAGVCGTLALPAGQWKISCFDLVD